MITIKAWKKRYSTNHILNETKIVDENFSKEIKK